MKLRDILEEATIPLAFIIPAIEVILYLLWMSGNPLGNPKGDVFLTLIYGGILVLFAIVFIFSFIGILLSPMLIEDLIKKVKNL